MAVALNQNYKRMCTRDLFLIFLVFPAVFFSCKQDTPNNSEPVPGGDAEFVDMISNQKSMVLDTASSMVEWAGSKPGKIHTGTLTFLSGSIRYAQSTLTGASVVLDMKSIKVTDLKGEARMKLESHLKGTVPGKEDDFFNIREYPEASFKSTKIVALKNHPDYNYLAYGMLRIKDVVQEVAFKLKADFEGDKLQVRSEKFSIDRTDWGIRFKSRSFSDKLKDDFISDEIQLSFTLNASAAM